FHQRESGKEFQDPHHFYSLDIDLFGRGSFFQFINRTTIQEGTERLANILTANSIDDIELQQHAIQELSEKPSWRQQFSAVATLIAAETPALRMIAWLNSPPPVLPKTMKWLPKLLSLTSICVLASGMFHIIDLGFVRYSLLFALIITGLYLKKI